MHWLTTGFAAFALGAASLVPLSAPTTAQDAAACSLDTVAATPAAAATTAAAETGAARPAWLATALVDACSGRDFSLAGFAGKTVFVHPMATWWLGCRDQFGRAVEAQTLLDPEVAENVVFVGLSIETGLPPEDLAAYAEREGFPFAFAVMSAEFQREFVAAVGREAVVPALMPHLVIDPDGEPGPLTLGARSPEELAAELTAVHTGEEG